MKIQLDMYQTIAAAVLVLMLGKYLKRKCSILEKFCIPAPVIGGVIFAVFTCICYVTASITPASTSFKEDSTILAIYGAAAITSGTIVAVEP